MIENSLKEKLISIVQEKQTKEDPSHDFQHVLRVTNLAEKIGVREKADLEILIPAALFHDVIVYRKDTPSSKNEADESAELAEQILEEIENYPKDKIENVKVCIKQCSFSKGITPNLLEAKILQDADRLEATGAISILRTFSSGGQMRRPFYDPTDPFREKTEPTNYDFGIDLFYKRLLLVEKMMHTDTARKMAQRRTEFLRAFLEELKQELLESEIIEEQ